MYLNVEELFERSWALQDPPPEIAKIYLITWPKDMRASFEAYRDGVAPHRGAHSKGKGEIKAFRSERRGCTLGDDRKNLIPCRSTECKLCMALTSGFRSSLEYKRSRVRSGAKKGARFGAGVYMTPASNKALQYAENTSPAAKYAAVLVTRVALGNQQPMEAEDHKRMHPDTGYDSVVGVAEGGHAADKEYVVYDENAVRPAYLVMVKRRSFYKQEAGSSCSVASANSAKSR
jgi:hypothetical protein